MPLPDERPRQSVANLIGRFEKQKSSSGAPAPPPTFPRTSSVSSYRTEDSAQEEIKERREWPPKSVGNSATSLAPPDAGPGRLSLSSSSISSLEKENLASTLPDPVLSTAPAEDTPSTPAPPTVTPPTQPVPAKARSSVPIQSKSTTPRPVSSVKSPTPKPVAKSSNATPLKSTATGGSTSSTPLRPQHTGQSTTSIVATPRTVAKRVSGTPKPPVMTTPSRAKTPLSAARSKTPSSDVRPKTPSSGLYAPTAASLARSRAGLPAPPPVDKPRRRLTTDLSKPTAASASKMRTPAATPTRAVKAPAGKPAGAKLAAKPAAISGKQSGPAKPSAKTTGTGHSKASSATNEASSAGHTANANIAASTILDTSQAIGKAVEEQGSEEASNFVAPVDGNAVESEAEGATETLEDASHEEDSQTFEEQDTLFEEEIESYDEDFPDESHYEAHVQHENVDAGTEGLNERLEGSSVIEEPSRLDSAEPVHVTHDTSDQFPISEEDDNHLEVVGEAHPLPPPASEDASTDDLHSSKDIELHEESFGVGGANPTTVGTDLEDIVNLLESGVDAHRPSVEVSSGASTVVAGDIPDEY